MKSKALWIAAIVLLVVTAACSSKEFPTGVYKPVEPSPENRVTEFKFAEDGTYAVSYYSGLKSGGAFTVSGDQITLNESEDSPCFGLPITMSWTSDGNTLTLKAVEDTCPVRPTTDWAGEWSRQP